MKAVAVFEAKTRLSELLAEVERGGEVVITRHGTAVARLVGMQALGAAAGAPSQRQRVRTAVKALARLRQGVVLDVPLRQALEDGRE